MLLQEETRYEGASVLRIDGGFSGGRRVSEALAGVHSQTMGDWQVVDIGDGSRDRAWPIFNAHTQSGPNSLLLEKTWKNRPQFSCGFV